MKEFFRKTAGKISIVVLVCVCVLVVFAVKTGQDAAKAQQVEDGLSIEQILETSEGVADRIEETPNATMQPTQPFSDTKNENTPAQNSEGANTSTAAGADAEKPLPVFVEFGAEWCMFCKEMQPLVAEIKEEYAGKLDFVYVDIDKNPQEAAMFGASSVPYFVLIDENGEASMSLSGAVPKDTLKDFIKQGVGVEL